MRWSLSIWLADLVRWLEGDVSGSVPVGGRGVRVGGRRGLTRWVAVASARLICTKHSVQMGWSQHREVLRFEG